MEEEAIEGYRLSPQQKHLWRQQYSEQSQSYRAQCAVMIEGALDPARLKRAIEGVYDRYEILRTSYHLLRGMSIPIQVITAGTRPDIREHDLSALDEAEQAKMLDQFFQEMIQTPFAFQQSPLLRLLLAALSPVRHVLLVSLPGLSADSAGLRNLLLEIARVYAAPRDGEALSTEPLQYADIAEWQNELFESDESRMGRDFWREQGIAELFTIKLPFERQRQKEEFQPQLFSLRLSPETKAEIDMLARRYETSAPTIFLALWQVLLARLSDRSEIVVGAYYDGRVYEEVEETLGLLGKYIPVRSLANGDTRLYEFIGHLNSAASRAGKWQECFSWRDVPGINADDATSTFFPLCFDYQEFNEIRSEAGISFSIHRQYVCTDRFRIKLACVCFNGAQYLEFHYDPASLAAEDIHLLAEQYRSLLDAALKNPRARLAELQTISQEEHRKLLIEFNDTRTDRASDVCIHHFFEEQARLRPDDLAVVFEDEQLTYEALNRRANQLARYLRRLGVGPEALVGLSVERSLDMVIGLLAVLKAGGAYLPLDPSLPKERLSFMITDARPLAVLTHKGHSQSLSGDKTRVIELEAEAEVIARERSDDPASGVRPGNLAYVLFTSGSTGRPKGVAIEHRQLVNYVRGVSERLLLPAGASYAMVSTFAADLGNTVLFPALSGGGCLHIIALERASAPLALAEYFDHYQIDCLKITPSHLEALHNSVNGRGAMPARCLVLGGEASQRGWVKRLESVAPNCSIINHYGPTEATVGVLTHSVSDEWGVSPFATLPLGRPINQTQVYLLDSSMQPVSTWIKGELHIGGASLARGYLNRPELTAERFVPSHLSDEPGARLYKTGDLARFWPEGSVEFVGRVDHQVKVRGFRIELGEIESTLRQHGAVREAIVNCNESDEGRLVAYVVADQHRAPTASELRGFLEERLPAQMLPSAFVMLKSLPLTANGKVDRKALLAPDRAGSGIVASYLSPRDDVEKRLAAIWGEVLGVGRVGVRDGFFELGGHSLLALQLMARIRQEFGKEISPDALLQATTIERMANLFRDSSEQDAWSPLVALQSHGSKPPFFCIHPVAGNVSCYADLARRLGTERPFYGLQSRMAEPHSNVEEMAACYLNAVREVQPAGPYLLGGWSMGGAIACEMASQLIDQGQEVALLVLMDRRTRDLVQVERSDEVLSSLFDETLEVVRQQIARANLPMPEIDSALYRQLFNVFKTNHLAIERYDPRPYSGRITLFRANESLSVDPDPLGGWGELARGGVELLTAPGTHTTMLLEPHVGELAEQLKRSIERATSANPRAVMSNNGKEGRTRKNGPVSVRPLPSEERQRLTLGSQSGDASRRRRCRILLASADGERVSQIARNLGCAPQTVRNVIHAFNREGPGYLECDSEPFGATQSA